MLLKTSCLCGNERKAKQPFLSRAAHSQRERRLETAGSRKYRTGEERRENGVFLLGGTVCGA